MAKIEKQVAAAQVKQYEIAKRGSDKMQTCVQAGMVEVAFLQATDEANYNKWDGIEKTRKPTALQQDSPDNRAGAADR